VTAIGVCVGKPCRRRPEHDAVLAAIAPACRVVKMSCSGICVGPVLVLAPGTDDAVVLAKVRSEQAVRDVGRWSRAGGALPKRLRQRRVKGSKRRKALLRGARAQRR
jgi:hypothetical protein